MDENNIKMIECDYCGEMVSEDDIVEIDGHKYCHDCVSECAECGEVMPCFKLNAIGEDEYVCSACLEQNYTYCDACDEFVRHSYVALQSNGHAVCYSCYDNGYRICENCGAVFDSDMRGDYDETDDVWYCDDCAPNYAREYSDGGNTFMDYYSNPEFRFYGGNGRDGKLYYGVELEVDDGTDAYDCAEKIMNDNEEIYCKRDGSLSEDGFEIITHPCTLEYHLNHLDWDDVRYHCRDYEFMSDKAHSSCGLHIHIGKNGLGNDADAKLVTIVDHIWDDFCKFTRRWSSDWARRPEINRIDSNDSEYEMINKAKGAKNGNRYQAVNLETGEHHKNTVEIRAYKGTLNVRTIKACLIFTDCLARYANTHTIKQCSVATIYDIAAMSDNPILKEYMERRGLVNGNSAN